MYHMDTTRVNTFSITAARAIESNVDIHVIPMQIMYRDIIVITTSALSETS